MFRKALLPLAVALAVWAPAAFAAAPVVLKFATVSPPQGPLNQRMLHPWAERVNKAGKGVVEVDVRDGYALANFGNIYGRVLNDVVQVGDGLQSAVAGKFPLTDFITLPMQYDRPDVASQAFWRVYAAGLLDSEYNEVVPLFLGAFANSDLQMARPLDKPTDLDGKKIIAVSKIGAEVIEALGGTPVTLMLTEMYPALQRHTVDGVEVAWTAFRPFKLGEVTTYHVETRLGGASGMIFMSRKRFDALPAAARKVLMDESGEKTSRLYGAYWAKINADSRKDFEGKSGHTIVEPTRDENNIWREKLQKVVDRWVSADPQRARVLAAFQKEQAAIVAGH